MNNQISAKSNIGGHVVLFTLIRTVINSAYRMVYAMQPLLAASIGVNLGDLAVALSIRSLLALSRLFWQPSLTHTAEKKACCLA